MAVKRYGPYVHKTRGYIFFIEYDNSTKEHRTIREHREIMEGFLGRELLQGEIVHHRDGRRNNNSVSNLEVMNQDEHMNLHLGDGILADQHGMIELLCVVCGEAFERHVGDDRKRIRHGRGGPYCGRVCAGKGTFMKSSKRKAINSEKRFWAKVERGEDFECWDWIGAVSSKDGVGVVQRNGKRMYAHRVAWELLYGLLNGARLRRSCGNKLCVNPRHMAKHE